MMGAIANSGMGMPNPQEKPAQGPGAQPGGQNAMPQPEVNQPREMTGVQEVREQRQQAIQDVAESMRPEGTGDKARADSDPTGAMGSNIDVLA